MAKDEITKDDMTKDEQIADGANSPAPSTSEQPSGITTPIAESDSFWKLPFGIQWRKALVSAPRLVPLSFLKVTSGEGPQPFLLDLPSRGPHRIPIYVFVPTGLTKETSQRLPVVLDFHGGGFVLGSCLEQAPFCAKLARDLRCVVITVDYRMGPASKFPAAIIDAEDVLNAVIKKGAPGYEELRTGIAEWLWKAWEKEEKETRKEAEKEAKLKAKEAEEEAKKVSKEKEREVKKLNAERPRMDRFSSKTNTKGNIKSEAFHIHLDETRISFAGFSSGGNLALNLALNVGPPQVEEEWPSQLPSDFPNNVPLLLFYPSFDCRQLPTERNRPANMEPPSGAWWSTIDSELMPTYLPREQAGHPRASPGLANLPNNGLHQRAKMLLVLPEMDTLSEQSEDWVKKVEEEGRGGDLIVQRFKSMKHGWTQMPESWLSEEEKQARLESYEQSVQFLKDVWEDAREEMP